MRKMLDVWELVRNWAGGLMVLFLGTMSRCVGKHQMTTN